MSVADSNHPGQNDINTVFLAGKLPNTRSYKAHIYGSGKPYTYHIVHFLNLQDDSCKVAQADGGREVEGGRVGFCGAVQAFVVLLEALRFAHWRVL
jgi:hypothetical protein